MNLNAYDTVNPIFNTTWIVPENKKLYSKIIPYYKYYTFLKKYNKNDNVNDYYIAFSNEKDNTRTWFTTYFTNSKAIKIDLSFIWNDKIFKSIYYRREVELIVDNEFNDGIIYKIEE